MIDSRAVIHEGAKIADNVEIGPYSIIGPEVDLASGCIIKSHVVISGKTTIGQNTKIFPFSSIGEEPIDRKYYGEDSQTIIGKNNIIREGVTIHAGTHKQEGNRTVVGDNNLIMNYVHIGHDCRVGNNITLVNYSALAGHVQVDDYATIGVSCGVHQFSRIGKHVFVAHGTMVNQDVPPYLMVTGGTKATPCGINIEGLKRANFSKEEITTIRLAYKIHYRQGNRLVAAIEKIKELALTQNSNILNDYVDILENTQRGVIR